jgi:hypothetical protein
VKQAHAAIEELGEFGRLFAPLSLETLFELGDPLSRGLLGFRHGDSLGDSVT